MESNNLRSNGVLYKGVLLYFCLLGSCYAAGTRCVYLEAPSSVDNMQTQLCPFSGSVKFTQERSMQLLEVIELRLEITNKV